MKHFPTPQEQSVIDLLLERLDFELVLVRLTGTMLEKAIMDARAPLRARLAGSGLADYGAIPQGSNHKVQLRLPFVTDEQDDARTYSFYRPATKQGDPRVWIARLGDEARPGDLLAFAFSGDVALAFLVRGDAVRLAERLSRYLPSRFEERGRVERTVSRLIESMSPLKGKWVRTRRPGPTGVGYTLESLLGIEANTRQDADIDGVELKAYRRGALTGQGKLVTLFSKTPNWLLEGEGKGLLRRFGYFDNERGRQALYCTITCRPNSLRWSLQLRPDERRLLVSQRQVPAMYYTFATLEARLKEKHPATLFIQASCRGRGEDEEFRYDGVILCRAPSFTNFLDILDEDAIGLDLTLSERENGTARDHGYLWRIREPRLPQLFAYRRPIISRP